MIMDFVVVSIFLMLSTVADLAHHEDVDITQCKTVTTLCNYHLNNVQILEQLVDIRIRAALARLTIPGTPIYLYLCTRYY